MITENFKNQAKYNVGIIGCGDIGSINNNSFSQWPVSHIAAYSQHPATEVLAVADKDINKAKECAIRWHVSEHYQDYKKMLYEKELDIISICTPYETHAQIIRDILSIAKKTKAIFCEKPLTNNLDEAREISKLCMEKGIILAVNFQRRHDQFYEIVKNNLYSLIGETKKIIFTYAGGITNTGSHAFDLLRYYFGEIEEVKANYETIHDRENYELYHADPNLIVSLTFKSGLTGTLFSCTIPNHSSFGLTIFGTSAAIDLINKPFFDYDYRYFVYIRSSAIPTVTCMSSEQSFPLKKDLPRDLFYRAVDDIVQAVEGKKAVESSSENGLISLELVSAALMSAQQNKPIQLPLVSDQPIILPVLKGVVKQWEQDDALALFGGKKKIGEELPVTNNLGVEEKKAVMRVMDRGVLSGFVAKWDQRFFGGEEVLNFEKNFSMKFGVKHAVSFNSATTALHGAIAAIGIGPGDEVITSPYTMTATSSAILLNQGIPVFADIDPDNFCLDPNDVEKKITPYTKAILVVNIFGNMPKYNRLLEIAKQHNLIVIEDCAQAPGAAYKGRLVGTIGDIGVFSYNFHKTIQCGEGGILITNNDKYALRAQLLRNHGEVVVDEMEDDDPRKQECILGNNYRLSELHAAIADEQLKKLDFLTDHRIALADYLTAKLKEIPGLTPCNVEKGNKHVYYLYPILFNSKIWEISRDQFVNAMKAEGAPISSGYVKPLYLIPMYQKRMAYSNTNYPFDSNHYRGKVRYEKGICPTTERMYEKEMILTDICRYPLNYKHMDMFIAAIKKIYRNRELLNKKLDLK